MTFRVKYKGLDVECDSILDLEKLTPTQTKPVVEDPKQLTLPFSEGICASRSALIGGSGPWLGDQRSVQQPKIVPDETKPRIQGVEPATAWRIMSKYERNAIVRLVHLRNFPMTVGVPARDFHRISGGHGCARGLSGFNRVVSRMAAQLKMQPEAIFDHADRRYFPGPRIDEFIRAYTGMQIQQILDIITKPDKK